jgi:O-antigen ligase
MRRLWLFCFPLLFVPNLGFSHQTGFGVLEVSDLLVVPLIFFLLIAQPARFEQRVGELKPWLWGFLGWALLSTLSIHFRYDYLDSVPIVAGCCLKLGRLALYVAAGLLITRSLGDPKVRQLWMWSLVAALFMISVGLLAGSGDHSAQSSDTLEGYKSYNVIIVSVAMLCSYLLGLWSESVCTRRWNAVAGIAVLFGGSAVVLSTSLSTHGRGGWVAFAAGFGYIAWKRIHTVKILAITAVLSLVALASYHTVSTFKSLVDETFIPDTTSGTEQVVDDGARLWSWRQEGAKFIDAPVFGTGFYHRGGASGLWKTGSHNFFLQMFLETGIVGGVLMVMIFAVAWRQAGLGTAVQNKLSTATRAALITAIAGGISGEYFYGGIGVMVLFSVLALSGSLPYGKLLYVNLGGNIHPLRRRVAV